MIQESESSNNKSSDRIVVENLFRHSLPLPFNFTNNVHHWQRRMEGWRVTWRGLEELR